MNPIADHEHNCRLQLSGSTLVFSDGYIYPFVDANKLRETFTAKYFPPGVPITQLPSMDPRLAKVGDSMLKTIMSCDWKQRGDTMGYWAHLFDYGVAVDTYLATMADATGLTKQLEIGRLSVLHAPSNARESSEPHQ